MSKNKFKIDDHVKNLLTGNKVTGTIIGLITGDFYLLRKELKDVPYWSRLYANWKEKCVYFVKLDKPTAHCTYSDFIEHKPDDVTEMEAVLEYQKIPKLDYMAYPEDDLKKV